MMGCLSYDRRPIMKLRDSAARSHDRSDRMIVRNIYTQTHTHIHSLSLSDTLANEILQIFTPTLL